MPVQILIDENDTINAIITIPQVAVEIIASVVRQDDTITLNGLHLEKLSDEPLGRKQITRLCAEFCRHYQVDKLVVQGARRTTGRSAGRLPKPLVYQVSES